MRYARRSAYLDVVLAEAVREAVKALPAEHAAKVRHGHVVAVDGVGVVLAHLWLRGQGVCEAGPALSLGCGLVSKAHAQRTDL